MSEDQDDSQKTEEPSHKRLEEAQKKGQIVSSREVNSFLLLFVLTLIVMALSPYLLKQTSLTLTPFLATPEMFAMDRANLGHVLLEVLQQSGVILVIPLLATTAVALAAGFMQNRFNVSAEPLKPKLEKISIKKGLGRLFSRRSVVEFLKGIIKITIVGVVSAVAIWPQLNRLKQVHDYDMMSLLDFLGVLTGRMLMGVCMIMFLIAIIDYLYQYFEYMKSMRMSKQELKDEYKQQEGDPMIKQRLRSLRMEKAKKRMMTAIPTSDVVITNPTHFAVALKYEQDAMGAPKVVAKGQDYLALHMRELAKKHDVPIVENPPLARALYQTVEIDKEIPLQHYKAVAEVISYVYKLKGKGPMMSTRKK